MRELKARDKCEDIKRLMVLNWKMVLNKLKSRMPDFASIQVHSVDSLYAICRIIFYK